MSVNRESNYTNIITALNSIKTDRQNPKRIVYDKQHRAYIAVARNNLKNYQDPERYETNLGNVIKSIETYIKDNGIDDGQKAQLEEAFKNRESDLSKRTLWFGIGSDKREKALTEFKKVTNPQQNVIEKANTIFKQAHPPPKPMEQQLAPEVVPTPVRETKTEPKPDDNKPPPLRMPPITQSEIKQVKLKKTGKLPESKSGKEVNVVETEKREVTKAVEQTAPSPSVNEEQADTQETVQEEIKTEPPVTPPPQPEEQTVPQQEAIAPRAVKEESPPPIVSEQQAAAPVISPPQPSAQEEVEEHSPLSLEEGVPPPPQGGGPPPPPGGGPPTPGTFVKRPILTLAELVTTEADKQPKVANEPDRPKIDPNHNLNKASEIPKERRFEYVAAIDKFINGTPYKEKAKGYVAPGTEPKMIEKHRDDGLRAALDPLKKEVEEHKRNEKAIEDAQTLIANAEKEIGEQKKIQAALEEANKANQPFVMAERPKKKGMEGKKVILEPDSVYQEEQNKIQGLSAEERKKLEDSHSLFPIGRTIGYQLARSKRAVAAAEQEKAAQQKIIDGFNKKIAEREKLTTKKEGDEGAGIPFREWDKTVKQKESLIRQWETLSKQLVSGKDVNQAKETTPSTKKEDPELKQLLEKLPLSKGEYELTQGFTDPTEQSNYQSKDFFEKLEIGEITIQAPVITETESEKGAPSSAAGAPPPPPSGGPPPPIGGLPPPGGKVERSTTKRAPPTLIEQVTTEADKQPKVANEPARPQLDLTHIPEDKTEREEYLKAITQFIKGTAYEEEVKGGVKKKTEIKYKGNGLEGALEPLNKEIAANDADIQKIKDEEVLLASAEKKIVKERQLQAELKKANATDKPYAMYTKGKKAGQRGKKVTIEPDSAYQKEVAELNQMSVEQREKLRRTKALFPEKKTIKYQLQISEAREKKALAEKAQTEKKIADLKSKVDKRKQLTTMSEGGREIPFEEWSRVVKQKESLIRQWETVSKKIKEGKGVTESQPATKEAVLKGEDAELNRLLEMLPLAKKEHEFKSTLTQVDEIAYRQKDYFDKLELPKEKKT